MLKFTKKTALKFALTTALIMPGLCQAIEIKLGGKNFTEQYIIAEATHQLLKAKGFDSSKIDGMGTSVLRKAMEHGQIDVYWEYTGTSLVAFNKIKDRLDPQATYAKVKKLDAKKGITWLTPSKANNTFAFAMRAEGYDDINTLSDLAQAYNNGVKPTMSFGAEFSRRPDGLPGLEKAYKFKASRDHYVLMESGLIYNALKGGDVDVGQVFATDGRIAAFNLKVLKDDAGFFPNYALVPTVRTEILQKYPTLENILNSISEKLNDTVLQDLNARVDVEKQSVESVATHFLKENNLI